MKGKKTFFNWSSGKDSALALHYLFNQKQFDVSYLLTTVNAHYDRVSMHGVRVELLEQQLEAIGIPSGKMELPEMPSNAVYEELMGAKLQQLKDEGYGYAGYGDIFLEDLKTYREEQLKPFNIKAIFPIWKKDTRQLVQEFIDLGFKAVVVCANSAFLDESFAGRLIDQEFLQDLPDGVDPCGENGEFHTFCFDAPYFRNPVAFSVGEVVTREYEHGETTTSFWFCDLLTGDSKRRV